MSALTAMGLVGVNEYQTVCSWLMQYCGSPASVVASVLSTESLNGSTPTTVAKSKLSFVGGAAYAGCTLLRVMIKMVMTVATFVRNLEVNIEFSLYVREAVIIA